MGERDADCLEARAGAAWSVSLEQTAPPLDETELRSAVDPQRGAPARTLEEALAVTRERHGVDFRSARARAGIARGHLLDVVVELPGGRGDTAEHEAMETLLELVLGEARMADWIGDGTLVPAPRGGALKVVQARPDAARFFPLVELKDAIEAAVAGIHAGLPDAPLWSLGGEQRWYLLELEGTREQATPESDLVLVSTCMPELLKSYLAGAPFASTRFSRAHELFAYLRYENDEADVRRALSRRRVLEDALDAALVSEQAGRVIGGGMGVRHSQVHFALERAAHGVGVVRQIAAKVGLGGPAGAICFCDHALVRGVGAERARPAGS
jgi:hypothetical protein